MDKTTIAIVNSRAFGIQKRFRRPHLRKKKLDQENHSLYPP